MRRLGRIMVSLGVVATLGMGVPAVLGLRGIDSESALRVHVLSGLIPLLLFVLSHLWILIYLVGAIRVIRSRSGGGAEPVESELASSYRVTLPVLIVAIGLAIACFVFGTGVWGGWATARVHGTLFYLAVLAEAFAAWREWRTFSAAERSIQRLEAAA